jgi:polyhydroxybutyrate depolymerase
MKLISKLACCFGLLVCVPTHANEIHSMDVDGVKRSYLLHVPVGIGPSVPLVVLLHGRGSSGADEMAGGRWQTKADKEKFIVAAPDALDSYDGVERKRSPTVRDWIRRNYRALRGRNVLRWHGGQNDVALIVSMIDRIGVERQIDQSRIYIVGFSRGGFMAHRMALEITDRLAGVAVVSPDVEPEARKAPTRPLSFLLVSGDRDSVHPVSSDRPAATMERWRAVDRCPPLSNVDSESAGLTVEGAGPCNEGTEIRYVIAHGVAHDWTEALTHYSDISWAFLSRFRRQPVANQ